MAEENNGWNAEKDTQPTTPITPAEAPAPAPTPASETPTNEAPTEAVLPVDDAPDYSVAKGESTVVSGAPQPPADAPYRPAPEYGAYGPTPTPAQNQTQPANAQPAYGASNQAPQQTDRNPYYSGNPFTNPQGQAPQNPQAPQFPPQGPQGPQGPTAPGNPFGAPNGQPGQPGPNANGQRTAAKPLSSTAKAIIAAVVAALVAAALCLGLGFAAVTEGWVKLPASNSLANVNSNQSGSGSATAKTGEAPDWQAVAKQVSGSVVAIQTIMQNGSAKGSGAVIDAEKGYVVTNNHVISGAQKIQVTLSNGQMYSAQLVGTDVTTDLAVIKLDNPPSDLKAVEFADSSKLAVGENVMAVGNPLGYDDTATTGIVSALNRPVSVMDEESGSQIVTNAVQIDAAINPGNSGGPTFNAAGQMIGINSSIASTSSSSDTAGSIGIGFAIPSNLVKRVSDEIIKDGKVKHVALGVTIRTNAVESDGVTRAGAQIVTPSTGGSAVVSGGPADKAGLKVNDTIVAFDGNAVNSNESLLGFVRAAALGDKATLTIVRDGKTMDVEVTLDQQEESVNGTNKSESGNGNSQDGNGLGGQNGQNGQGNGQGGQDDQNGGDWGGLSDPFGLW